MARVLVVDDDPDILKLVQAVLAHDGHTAYVALDAIKAMELLRETMFDLLISDANMPQYSGFELVQTVRRDNRYRHMAICMLTGLRERKDIDRAIRAGVDDYIVKPIDPMLFSKKVTALFDKKPPAEHPEVFLASNSVGTKAKVEIEASIYSISELGVKILSSQPYPIGTTVELRSDFFEDLMVQTPPMKVLSCVNENGQFVVQLIYFGARDAFLQKVRAWIYSHGGTLRKMG